ncbi:MAG: GAF domain-containing protein [Chloroflexi bacterium]|nr:GAF domain-containing protein [Chloroflexota bacterium]
MTNEISNLKSQIRELTFLHETSQVLTATLDLDGVLRSLMTQVRDYFQVEAASVALLEEETGDAVFRIAVGKAAEEVVGLRMGPGEGVVGWVIQTGQLELVPIAHDDERFYTGIDDTTDFHAHAMLAIPIKIEGQTIGVIEVLNPAAGVFDPDARRLLIAVADLAAVAIRNAELYERVRRAERRYESLFSESTDPIVVLDLEGEILNLNQRMVEMFPQPGTQLLGTDICDLLETGRGECRAAIGQIQAGESLKVETSLQVLVPYDQQARSLETTMAKIDYGGRDAIQWVWHDISERVALEQMREDITHMIVHDLRNPLGSMTSSLQLIYNAFVERDQTLPLMKLLGIAMRSGQKLYRLIDSLLDLGRMEAGETDLNKTLVRPESLVHEAMEQVHPLTLTKGQTLSARLVPNLPRILVDEALILRVLTNLMDNAIKFTSYGGKITIGVEPVDGELQFTVADTGLGIPHQDRQRIFDRFARLESADGVKGTGIGLAFCKLAVEAHRGRIWVESEVGRGATFYFTLPLEIDIENHLSSLEIS